MRGAGQVGPFGSREQRLRRARESAIVLREALQQLHIKAVPVVGVLHPGMEVEPVDRRQGRRFSAGARARRHRHGRAGPHRGVAFAVARQRLVQQLGLERLADVGIHAEHQAALAFVGHRMRGDGDDRQRDVARIHAQDAGRLVAVHHRHLQVHQHDRIETRRMGTNAFQRLLSVVGHLHLRLPAFEQLHRELLVDRVVFHQQHAQARQVGRRIGLVRRRHERACIAGQPLDEVAQRFGQHRLGYEMARTEFLGIAVHQLRVVGRDDDRQRSSGQRPFVERAQHAGAVQAGHDPVDQQQVVRPAGQLGLIDHGQRALAVLRTVDASGREHADAERAQQVFEREPRVGLVVDHQNPHHIGARQCGRGRGRRHGERKARREDEARAVAGRALDPDRAAHQLDDALGDREAEPGAAVATRCRAVGLGEFLEQPLDLFGRHADARIANREAQRLGAVVARFECDRELDVAAVGELHRIRQQVAQHLAQAQCITHQRSALAEQARLAHVEQQFDVLFVCALAQQRERIAGHVLDPEAPFLQFELAGLDLREIEDVVDDPEQRSGRVVDLVHVVALACRQLGLERQVGHTENRIHRGSDLVAHVGEEHRLGARRILRQLARRLELDLRGLAPADIAFDRLRHGVHGRAQQRQLVDPADGRGALGIVAGGKPVRIAAQLMDRHQHLAADHAQRDQHRDDGGRHAGQRHHDPARQPAFRGADFGPGALVG